MGRQPFFPQFKEKHFCFDGRGLEHNVYAAALLGRIFSEWSRAEHQITMLLAAALGNEPDVGIAIFTAVRNARAQRDIMNAVAETAIGDDVLRRTTGAVLDFARTVAKARDDLAHGVLGWSFDLPEVTLWVPANKLALYEASSWFRCHSPSPAGGHSHTELEKMIYIYKADDLSKIVNDIVDASQILFKMYCVIRNGREKQSDMWREVQNHPEIMSRMR